MPRKSPGRASRRTAIALSLMLVATLVTPAFAQPAPQGTFTATGRAGVASPSAETANFSFTLKNTTSQPDIFLDYADIVLPEGVTSPTSLRAVTTPQCLYASTEDCPDPGAVPSFALDVSDSGNTVEVVGNETTFLASGESVTVSFTASAACDTAYTFEVDARQLQTLGADPNRAVDRPLALEDDAGLTFTCSASPSTGSPVTDEQDGESVSAVGPNRPGATISLAYQSLADAGDAETVFAACEEMLDPDEPQRLANNVVEVLPEGFLDGDELEVTFTLPPELIKTDPASWDIGTADFQVGSVGNDASFTTDAQILQRLQAIRANRGLDAEPASDQVWLMRINAGSHDIGDARTAISAKGAWQSPDTFQTCMAPDKPATGSLAELAPLAGTALYGPVFLASCETTATPCIQSRTKVEGEILIVARVPAEDPMFR